MRTLAKPPASAAPRLYDALDTLLLASWGVFNRPEDRQTRQRFEVAAAAAKRVLDDADRRR